MYQGQTVFSQLMDFLPQHAFRKCVNRYQGNYRMRSFSCYDQFLCMAFAQLTFRESLRDIECCLGALEEKLYHAGFRGQVSRSTLADANENRDWRIYADFAQLLIHQARTLYLKEDFGVQLNETVYALDSSTIDLCLSLFPWARFRKTKAGIKLHTLLDLRGSIPSFIAITEAKLHDVNILDELVPEPGAIYVMDRGYLDFERLYAFHQAPAFFVIRSKSNTDLRRSTQTPSIKTAVCVAIKSLSSVVSIPIRAIPRGFAGSNSMTRNGTNGSRFSPISSPCRPQPSRIYTAAAGRWRRFSSGSSSTFASKPFMGHLKMR